jgi:two-component system, OmpR family, phosphate regulon sensor histidine kinase PhoR
MRLSLQWKILIGYLVVGGIGLGTAGWLALDALQAKDLEQIRAALINQARLSAEIFAAPLSRTPADMQTIDTQADRLGEAINARVTVIAPDGTVLGDSFESGQALRGMDNHLSRPEVRDALLGGLGTSIRLSDTVGIRMLNVALTVHSPPPDSRLLGLVRLSLPLTQIETRDRALRQALSVALGGAFLLSLGLSYLVARSITRPLDEMVSAAARMGRGEFRPRLRPRSGDELADLALVLNQMAASLEETIGTLTEDRAKMSAILTAMQEGMMVLSSRGTVSMINPAMEKMIGRPETEVLGRPHVEVIRQPRLNAFITHALSERGVSRTEIALTISQRVFQVHASAMPDERDRGGGMVLVFHDITELRRLEQVRKDFVANVSHELRTPLTAINGYLEALQDVAYGTPEQRDRFLEIIRMNTHRLNLIISDLLLLSKIESGQMPLHLEPILLSDLVQRTVGLLNPLIEQKQHRMVVEVPKDLPSVLGDQQRLTEILSNLLDNAIKYTPNQGTITISATAKERSVELSISDTGVGIPPQDLPRIFERFYRVDKARSRELGGTGLGLAIVKHLVEAHGGTVRVESVAGGGTCFRIMLPDGVAHAA